MIVFHILSADLLKNRFYLAETEIDVIVYATIIIDQK